MALFYISSLLTVSVFIIAGMFIGKNLKTHADFSLGGRKSSTAGVTGVLLGALVGGASTVGTVQMAYVYGMSAIWFTTGGGLGCLLLWARFAQPIRESEITTVSDYLEKSYAGVGGKIALVSAVSSSIGTFISVCAQFLSCVALLLGAFPVPAWLASVASACLIMGFIATGGIKSFSKLGSAKIILLYAVLTLCVVSAVKNGGTIRTIFSAFTWQPWLNPFALGFNFYMGAIVSMIIGILTTQIYVQSIAAARDVKTARAGALASALLMPPMGFLGTWIGLSVRARGIEMPANQVLPWFIMDSFAPLTAGVIWAGIMITVIGCASGLLLGVSTNITQNLIPRRFAKGGAGSAATQRIVIFALLVFAVVFSAFGRNALILNMSYMGMGLRGAGTFLPFVAAMLRPRALAPRWALASSAGGLIGMFAWAFSGLPGDPLFAGLAVSAACVAAGLTETIG